MAYTRKLQKIGESIFVSLPKTWVERMQLSKGDSVMLLEQPDYSVVIHPQVKNERLKQIVLNVDAEEQTRSLRRKITGAYVDGFDVIKLEATDRFTDEQEDATREITEDLFGLEIVELSANLVTIQCFLTKTLPIERMIQRIHSTIKSMFGETISALKDRNSKAARGVVKRTRDIRRFSLVLHRLLRSLILYPTEHIQEMKPIDCVDFLRVIDKITEVSASVNKIAESVAVRWPSFPDSILEPLLANCVRILELFDWSIQALMSKDIPLANRVLDAELEPDFDDLWGILMKETVLMPEISSPILSHVPRIIDSLKQMYVYALEIAEIAIDRAEELS